MSRKNSIVSPEGAIDAFSSMNMTDDAAFFDEPPGNDDEDDEPEVVVEEKPKLKFFEHVSESAPASARAPDTMVSVHAFSHLIHCQNCHKPYGAARFLGQRCKAPPFMLHCFTDSTRTSRNPRRYRAPTLTATHVCSATLRNITLSDAGPKTVKSIYQSTPS